MANSTSDAVLYWLPQSQLEVLLGFNPSLEPITIISMFIIGTFFGSFLNVVALRFDGLRWMKGGSRCCNCDRPIKWYFNIPVIGWSIQKGKSNCCNLSIPFRYVFVELLTGAVFVFVATMPFNYEMGIVLFIASILIVSSLIDYETMTLPLELHSIVFIASVIYASIHDGSTISTYTTIATSSAILLLVGAALWYSLRFAFKKEPFGGGDLLFLMSVYPTISLGAIPAVIMVATLSAIFLILINNKILKGGEMPFGPSLAIGWLIVFILNHNTAFMDISRDSFNIF